jgi:F-type H+-transporting ATPase subunit b
VKTLTHLLRQSRPRRAGIALRRRAVALGAGAAMAATPFVASAADDVEGIAKLGFNLPGLVSQLVNFLLILIILRLLLWKPFLKMLDERRERIATGLEAAERAAQAAEQSQEESKRALDEARAEGRELVTLAQETAGRLQQELEAQARREAEQIIERARAEMALETQRAVQALRAEFADLTVRAAERVVGQSLDRDAHQRLIDEVLVDSSFGQDGRN